jgi:hypothetical protein
MYLTSTSHQLAKDNYKLTTSVGHTVRRNCDLDEELVLQHSHAVKRSYNAQERSAATKQTTANTKLNNKETVKRTTSNKMHWQSLLLILLGTREPRVDECVKFEIISLILWNAKLVFFIYFSFSD